MTVARHSLRELAFSTRVLSQKFHTDEWWSWAGKQTEHLLHADWQAWLQGRAGTCNAKGRQTVVQTSHCGRGRSSYMIQASQTEGCSRTWQHQQQNPLGMRRLSRSGVHPTISVVPGWWPCSVHLENLKHLCRQETFPEGDERLQTRSTDLGTFQVCWVNCSPETCSALKLKQLNIRTPYSSHTAKADLQRMPSWHFFTGSTNTLTGQEPMPGSCS